MTKLRVGFIGTGKKKDRPDEMGFAMAYEHAAGYQALPQCELVACADIVQENAAAFAHANGIPADGVFTDYKKMLAESKLDVVSICTWPHLHAPMVLDSARAEVRAIHCEKPMADSWGAARAMEHACRELGVQLTFNHQRRFGAPFRKASELVKRGTIGDLQRIEIACPNIYDYGTHYIDACGLYADEQAAEWIIGQIDYSHEQRVFGAHVENQALGLWRYPSGAFGFISTGPGSAAIGTHIRLLGKNGVIEIGTRDEPPLRVRTYDSTSWETIDTGNETLHGPGFIARAIADIIQALESGRESELSARNALHATEIIFAIYESSRKHGRVDHPLTITDNPLVSLVETGAIQPQPKK